MDNELTKIVDRDVRPAMELIYDLRASGVEKDIEIPQVAVIGDQSSGKSSVLEAICSLPLPRGAGLTTRCAIELRLTDSKGDWSASVSTSRKHKVSNVDTIDALGKAIAHKAGELIDKHKNGGFSRERVLVEISAKNAPNLTLIDLPGIIRTETSGDGFFGMNFLNSQGAGAVREVTELIKSYVKQERTILLVVASCTQDIATVGALEWAKEADPSGKRTIGVLTKPDLIDDGAENEVAKVLSNKRKHLNLGYIMLKNRSQREVMDNLSVPEAREQEREYFSTHPLWSSMDRSLFGVENLISKISKVLVARIYESVPAMRNEVNTKLDQVLNELEEVGVGAGETPAEASMTLMRIIFDYNSLLTDAAAGRYVHRKLWDPKVRLCTRVRELYESFRNEVLATRPKFEEDSSFLDEIANEIRGSRGRELPGFLNPRIFESRVARYIETWRNASDKLVSDVRRLVGEVAHDLFTEVCSEFPGLRLRMHNEISTVVQDLERKTQVEVEKLLERELGQTLTLNDQFLVSVNARRLERFDAAVSVALSRAGRNPRDRDMAKLLRAWYEEYHCSASSQRVLAEAEDMTTMLGCYWDVAADRFVDNHVIIVENSFVKPLSEAIQGPMNEIVLNVSKSSEALDALLEEDPKLVQRRKELIASRDRLQNARKIINKF